MILVSLCSSASNDFHLLCDSLQLSTTIVQLQALPLNLELGALSLNFDQVRLCLLLHPKVYFRVNLEEAEAGLVQ